MAQARELGVAPFVIQTGYVPDEELPAYLSAVDVCLNLRWPTGRETSAAWIRCLAAGKPTIVTDLVHQTDVPSLDLRSMEVVSSGPAGAEPVCVHVELIDEIHMLRLALRRLRRDGELRARLGRAARRYWAEHATLELMARDYESALARAAALPLPEKPAPVADAPERGRLCRGAFARRRDRSALSARVRRRRPRLGRRTRLNEGT